MTCMNQGKPKCQKAKKIPNYLKWGANLATMDVAYKIAFLLMKGFKSQMCESNWHHFLKKTARWTKYSLGCPPFPSIVTTRILTFLGLGDLKGNRLICHTEHTHTPAVRPHSGWRAMTAPGTTWIDDLKVNPSFNKNHDQSTNPVVSWQSVSTKKIKAWR